MSVVTTWEAVPNRIEAVVRYLRGRTNVSTEEVYGVLSPHTLREARNVVSRVVDEASNLGLIEPTDGDRWNLTDEAAAAEDIRTVIAHTLLSPEPAADAEQDWVAPAIAWFLAQPTSAPLAFRDNWRTLVERDCPGTTNAFELVNIASCQQFAYWAVYLGFGWRFGTGIQGDASESLVPDPSAALESALRTTMRAGEELPISEAMSRVAKVCPVMEGGSVRQEVERQFATERRRLDGQLSRSTSFALARLEARGVVDMPRPPSDARVMMLTLWPEPRPVSQLRLGED